MKIQNLDKQKFNMAHTSYVFSFRIKFLRFQSDALRTDNDKRNKFNESIQFDHQITLSSLVIIRRTR